MDFSDYSLHDATILEGKELSSKQVIAFLIDYPIDWKKNIFEHRILKFYDVSIYSVNEMSFAGSPTMLEVA